MEPQNPLPNIEAILRNLHVSEEEYQESIVLYFTNREKLAILGPLYSGNVEFVEFQRGKLKAHTRNSAYLQNLLLDKSKILKRIQETVPKVPILQLDFRVGTVKTQIQNTEKVTGNLEGKEDLVAFLEKVENPEEKSALLRLISFL